MGGHSGEERDLATVGVIGAGVIGRGVSVAVARAGLAVILVDRSDDVLAAGEQALKDELRTAAMFSGERSEPLAATRSRISTTTRLEDLADVDLVVENATERWDVKAPIYTAIDTICAEPVIFAANTSAIPISRFADQTHRPTQVIGLHFMNPASIKPTVEVIRTAHTSEATIAQAMAFLGRIGKGGVVVNDAPGFVTNRVMMMTVNEAICLVDEGVASAREVDQLFIECFGHRMGPLETADLIGLDTVLLSLDVLRGELGDAKFLPSRLLCELVESGHLGRKSGKGFFDYRAGSTS